MRIAVATLALLTAALASSAAGATDPRSETVRLRPADVALAKRAVLQQSDVGPDWIRVPGVKGESQFECDSFNPDFSAFTITGQAYASYRIESDAGGNQIDSTVAVFPSRAQAVGDFRLGAKPPLADCLAAEMRRTFRRYPAGIEGRLLSAKMVTAPKLGEHAAAYAMTAELKGNGVSLRVYVDVLVVQRGRSMAALVFTATGSRMPSREFYAAGVVGRLR